MTTLLLVGVGSFSAAFLVVEVFAYAIRAHAAREDLRYRTGGSGQRGSVL